MKIELNRELKVQSKGLEMPLKKSSGSRLRLAFTLLEVMIAIGIFFTATFSILALVSQCLRSARMLNQNTPTPGMVAAQLSLTNKLEEGFEDGDFGDLYPDYTWQSETLFYASNGMFQVDVGVFHAGKPDSAMSFLLYRPESATGLSTKSKFSR